MSASFSLFLLVLSSFWLYASQRQGNNSERVLSNDRTGDPEGHRETPVDPVRPPHSVDASPNNPELQPSRLTDNPGHILPANPQANDWVSFGHDIDSAHKASAALEKVRLEANAGVGRDRRAGYQDLLNSEQIAITALRSQYNDVM